jgi:uncharacterized membrane protein YhaH (DUF805 family)
VNNIVGNFTGFDGRLNRQAWWISGIILGVVQLIVTWILGLIIPGGITIGADGTIDPASIAGLMQKTGWVGLITAIIFAYPFIAISIKRRHDKNNNGYDVVGFVVVELIYYLLLGVGGALGSVAFVVQVIFGIYGLYLLIVLGFLKGTSGPNNYGPDPLQG